MGQQFLRSDTKSTNNQGEIDYTSSKEKTFVNQGALPRKWKDNLENRKSIVNLIYVKVLIFRIYF